MLDSCDTHGTGYRETVLHQNQSLIYCIIFSFIKFVKRLRELSTSLSHKDEEVKRKIWKGKSLMEDAKKKKNNPQKWFVRIERWSQVWFILLLSKWSVMVNAVMVAEFAFQTRISVHLHLFRARLCLLASFVLSLPVCSLFGSRAIMSSAVLIVHLRGLFHGGLRPVDHCITYTLQFLWVWK